MLVICYAVWCGVMLGRGAGGWMGSTGSNGKCEVLVASPTLAEEGGRVGLCRVV